MIDRLNVLALGLFVLLFSVYVTGNLLLSWDIVISPIESVLGVVSQTDKDEFAIFVGDIMLARDVERKVETRNINPFANVAAFFKSATAVVGNFEAALPAQHSPTPGGSMNFSVRPELAELLSEAGVTNLSLANNHTLDKGELGYQNTKLELESLGLHTFGHLRDVSYGISVTKFSLGDDIVAVVGLNLVGNFIASSTIAELMSEVSSESQWQVAYLHWGEEYKLVHNQQQEEFAQLLIDNGADAVIGNHPHVVQDVAVYKGIPIFYSLGNFVFDQYFSTEVQQGLLLVMKIQADQLKFSLLPITSLGSSVQPRFMTIDERTKFLQSLQQRSPSYQID